MASQHSYSKQVSSSETLRAWVGDQRPDFEAMGNGASNTMSSARASISEAARVALAAGSSQHQDTRTPETIVEEVEPANSLEDDPTTDPKLKLLMRIVEALTGKKVEVMSPSEISKMEGVDSKLTEARPHSSADDTRPQGWCVEYDYHEEIHEGEKTSFTASGEIRTADGTQITFDLSLHMSREFLQESSISFRAGDAVRKDPLVINFDGNAAELSDMKFDFDIDADGQVDRISFVGPSSGFLALDKNGNGRIDDGSELFGAFTGDGFAELAAYDTDGNGWIDENDGVFSQLRTWTRDESGATHLNTLAERYIGALYLGKTATPFDLKDGQNRQHGQVLSTGVYLSESGVAGTIQQLDLFV